MTGAGRALAKGIELIALLLAAMAAINMVAIVAVIVTSVMMRRFGPTPLHIAEDVVGLLLSASLFLALPLVTLRARHIRVAIVAEALKERFERPVRIAAMVTGLAFFGWVLWDAIPWFEFAWKRNLKTETARLVLYPWMAVVPLAMALTWLIYFARLTGLIEAEHRQMAEPAAQSTTSAQAD